MPEKMYANCAWCGQDFLPKRNDALFCHPQCRMKYFRWKHRLDLLRSVCMTAMDDVAAYLEHKEREHEASLILGEMADRLAVLGFVAELKQMPIPESAYTEENQLGVENA